MIVYKYRGANFERDLKSLEKNFYWSAKFDDLNDPCETLINKEPFKVQSKAFANIFGQEKSEQFLEVEKSLNNLFEVRKKGIGIYSLSKTFKDELLWAHYANSHKGFCIEYDLELLANSYKTFETFSFPVIYIKKPPEYGIRDINNSKTHEIVQKLAGYKSQRWNYEQEHRIVTGFYGEHPYDPNGLKAIYFGLKMDESEKIFMMNRLKERNIQFYQIIQKYNSYDFDAIKVNDLTKERHTYFKEIPAEINKNNAVQYKIISKVYIREIKAMVEIELESKITDKQLIKIAKLLRNDMFRLPKRLFISFSIKNLTETNWATANFEYEELKSSINGLTIEQENVLVDALRKEDRETLGMWIDETPYTSSTMTLLKLDGELFLETNYFDGGNVSKKLNATILKGKIRYDDYEPNNHSEYFEVSGEGILNYCSENGVFLTLKPFLKNSI